MVEPAVGDILTFRQDVKLLYDVSGKRALVIKVEKKWDYVTDYDFIIAHVIVDGQIQDWVIDAFEGFQND